MPRRQEHPKTCDTDTTPTEQPQTHDWRSTADAAANIPNSLYVSRAGVYDPPDDSKKKKWFNRCRKLWQVSNPVLVVVMAVLLLYFAGKYTEEMGKLQARVQELEQDNERITTSAGPPGPIGPPGPSGEKGAMGPACPTGKRGAVGPAGPPGKRGAVGPAGPTGEKGAVGTAGPTGKRGAVGPAGPTGKRGAVGPAGPTGEKGAVGTAGPTGKRGAEGPAGPTGKRGAVGPAGPKGRRGVVGPAGPTGRKGAMGPAGPTGRKGAMGPVGPRGRKGAVGPAGPTGEKGAMGPPGPTGEKGPIRPVEAVRGGGSPGAFGPPGMSPGMPRRPERGSPCPEDGYKVYRGTCYKAFNTRKTFSDADATCRQDGGTLAMPKDRGIDDFLISLYYRVATRSPFWFGLLCKGTTWKWVDGSPLHTTKYRNWFAGRRPTYGPNSQRGAIYWRDVWHTFSMDRKANFICQVATGRA